MKVTDSIGEELFVGDLVAHTGLGQAVLVARIVSIREGGVSLLGGTKHREPLNVTPTQIRLVVDLTVFSNPEQPVGVLLKLAKKTEPPPKEEGQEKLPN